MMQDSMAGFPYEDLNGWRSIYPPAEFIAQLEKVAAGFESALARLAQATVPGALRPAEKKNILPEQDPLILH